MGGYYACFLISLSLFLPSDLHPPQSALRVRAHPPCCVPLVLSSALEPHYSVYLQYIHTTSQSKAARSAFALCSLTLCLVDLGSSALDCLPGAQACYQLLLLASLAAPPPTHTTSLLVLVIPFDQAAAFVIIIPHDGASLIAINKVYAADLWCQRARASARSRLLLTLAILRQPLFSLIPCYRSGAALSSPPNARVAAAIYCRCLVSTCNDIQLSSSHTSWTYLPCLSCVESRP